jgi:hypothetical protein
MILCQQLLTILRILSFNAPTENLTHTCVQLIKHDGTKLQRATAYRPTVLYDSRWLMGAQAKDLQGASVGGQRGGGCAQNTVPPPPGPCRPANPVLQLCCSEPACYQFSAVLSNRHALIRVVIALLWEHAKQSPQLSGVRTCSSRIFKQQWGTRKQKICRRGQTGAGCAQNTGRRTLYFFPQLCWCYPIFRRAFKSACFDSGSNHHTYLVYGVGWLRYLKARSFGRWLGSVVLGRCERKVLLASWWWLIYYERKVLLTGGW